MHTWPMDHSYGRTDRQTQSVVSRLVVEGLELALDPSERSQASQFQGDVARLKRFFGHVSGVEWFDRTGRQTALEPSVP